MNVPQIQSIIAILLLSSVHLWCVGAKINVWKKKLLPLASGISVAFVFIDLLPKLSRGQTIWTITNLNLPFLEKHVYFLSLVGVLFFIGIEKLEIKKPKVSFWISGIAYITFNILIGYVIAHPKDPEIQPFILFTIAIALHQWVRDHILCIKDKNIFKNRARFILVLALLTGWFLGHIFELHEATIALIIAFIGGGMIINIFHNEMPSSSKNLLAFIFGSLAYAILLLLLGG